MEMRKRGNQSWLDNLAIEIFKQSLYSTYVGQFGNRNFQTKSLQYICLTIWQSKFSNKVFTIRILDNLAIEIFKQSLYNTYVGQFGNGNFQTKSLQYICCSLSNIFHKSKFILLMFMSPCVVIIL
jgi:hypothetical protein